MHDHADWILSDNYLKHQKPNRHEDNQFLKRGTSTHTTTTKLASAGNRTGTACWTPIGQECHVIAFLPLM